MKSLCFALSAMSVVFVLGVPASAQSRNPGTVFRDCADCPEMVVIPSGSFMMGAPPDEIAEFPPEPLKPGHTPVHRVTIAKPFALGAYEVTKGQFAAFVRDTAHETSNRCGDTDLGVDGRITTQVLTHRDWRYPPWPTLNDRYPVTCVNHLDADAYTAWLSRKTGKKYRLPSEAEWEYAARAGTTTRWFWGDDPKQACQYANIGDLSFMRVRYTMETANDPNLAIYGMAPAPTTKKYFDCNDGYFQLAR